MPTPSGTISLGDVRSELQYSNTQISMNETDVRKLAGITTPASTISMNDLKSKSIVGNSAISVLGSTYAEIIWYANGAIATDNSITTTIDPNLWAFVRNGTGYGSDYQLIVTFISGFGSYSESRSFANNTYVDLNTTRSIEIGPSSGAPGFRSASYNAKIREKTSTIEVANTNFTLSFEII